MAVSTRVAFAVLAVTAAACSNLPGHTKTSSKRDGSVRSAADALATQGPATTAASTAAASATATDDGLTHSGLPDACQYKALDDKSPSDHQVGCFTCTPRLLPLVKCVRVLRTFDPAKSCTHDMSSLSCQVGAPHPFTFDLAKPSTVEQVYEDLPLLVFGAKALLATKLQGDPKLLDLINGTLDELSADKLALFTGGDVAPFLDAVSALVKKDEPSVPDARIAEIKLAAMAAITAIRARNAAGTTTHGDFLTFAEQLLMAFPPELVGPLLGSLDLGKITQNLQASGGSDSVAQLLAALGNGQSIDQVVGKLQSAQTATAAATSTEPATSTGTGPH